MRRSLASAPSLFAMAAMMLAAPFTARAQSFNATGTIVAGAGAISTGVGTTTVVANAPNLVINWSPDDTAIGGGAIDFQSAGTSALFTNGDSTALNVLNRILPADPTRAVVFNGTVTSQLIDLASGVASRGGTLFFYSPGGILVSPTGVFNVGNLALTTSDLNFDAVTGSFGTAGKYSFLAANPGSSVEVQKGARITAGPNNAYVALIAPKVINSGTVNVDGSAVIVAADASTITFRPDGLYDIKIDQGTSAAGEVVTNDGTITGPAAGANTSHRVYVVAVPKNDAITMAIKSGSALGFDVAGAANVDGNAVVLSAGYGITNGVTDTVRAKVGGAVPSTLTIGAIDATSQVTGTATGQASLAVGAGETATFASNLLLSGVRDPAAVPDDGAFISVGGIGSTLDVKGDLQVTALDAGRVAGDLTSDSGNASITVDQGKLTVGGSVTVSSARAPTVPIDALAGTATLTARNGAVVDVGADLNITASARGKTIDDFSASGPNPATGGKAQLSLESGSNISVGRDLVIDASGTGGAAFTNGFEGTNGTGGQAFIEGKANGGTLSVTGATTLDASGTGGKGQNCISCTIEGGTGKGGDAGIIVGKGVNFSFGNAVTVDATGQGGAATTDSGKDGGAGKGGSASITSAGGAATFAQTLDVLADGRGGAGALVNAGVSGATGSGGNGGSGTGGSATLAMGDAATLGGGGSAQITGTTTVSAVGVGGNGGTGGAGAGGTAALTAHNGSATGSDLTVRAYGDGGAGSNGGKGGAGTGGNADVMAYSALEGAATVAFGTTVIDAQGGGGAGAAPDTFPDAGGAGGSGTGGRARALAEAGNANLTLASATVNASGSGGIGGAGGGAFSSGTGGVGGIGGDGIGGTATLDVVTGGAAGVPVGAASFGSSSVLANGIGGVAGAGGTGVPGGLDGNGGKGTGGTATLTAEAGVLNLDKTMLVQAGATGGSSGTGTGGDAEVGGAGGAADLRGVRFVVGTGKVTGQAITLNANATAGKGATSGKATILGHPLTWLLGGGSVNATSLTFTATGTGAGDAPASLIALTGGDTVLTGDLNFDTPADLTATLDGANVSAVSGTIGAGNWLPGAVPAGTAGTLFGTTSVTLSTGGDLFAHLSANSGGALTLTAPGLVRLDNITASGDASVTAGTTVALGNVQSGGNLKINAPGNIAVGDLTATGSVSVGSGAVLTTGGATAGQKVTLDGATSLAVGGAVQAGDSVQLVSDGTIGAGAISAGLVSPSADPAATYGITVFGRGDVTLGNLAAAGDLVLLSPVSISSGSLAGREMVVLAPTQSLGAITAQGRVLLADFELFGAGGDPLGAYNLDAVFNAAPLPAAGTISVSGAANVGSLTAVSTSGITLKNVTAVQALTANGSVRLNAGGAIAAGVITADNLIDLQAGTTLNLTSASGTNGITLGATGAITSGNLTANNGSVLVTAGGAASLGDVFAQAPAVGPLLSITAGGTLSLGKGTAFGGDLVLLGSDTITSGNLETDLNGRISVTSTGAVNLGTLFSGTDIALNSGGALTGGGLFAQFGVSVLGSGSVALGKVSTGTGDVTLKAATDLTTGDVSTFDGITLTATAGKVSTGNVTSGNGAVAITAAGSVLGGIISAANGITGSAGTGLTLGSASTFGGDLLLSAGGDITTASLGANGGILTVKAGGAATLGAIAAAGLAGVNGIDLSSGGALSLGSATVDAGDLRLKSGGTLKAASITAQTGALAVTSGGNAALTGVATAGAGDAVFSATGSLGVGDINATGQISLTATGAISGGSLNAGGTLTIKGASIALAALGGSTISANADTTLSANAVTATVGDAVFSSAGDLSLGAVAAEGNVLMTSTTGGIATGDLAANGGTVSLTAKTSGSAGVVTAATGIALSAGTSLKALDATSAAGDISLVAGTDLTTGAVSAKTGLIKATATGAASLGNLTAAGTAGASGLTVSAGGTLALGNASVAAGTLDLSSTGALTAGNLSANEGVTVNGLAAVTVGDVTTAGGGAALSAGADLAAGSITAPGLIKLTSTTGKLKTGALTSVAADISATSAGTMDIVSASSEGTLTLKSGGVLTAGDLSGTSGVSVTGLGAVRAGVVTSTGGNVAMSSVGDLASGAVTADGAVALSSSGGALAAGNVTANGGTVSLAAKTAATAGNVLAASTVSAGAGGNLGLGNVSGTAVTFAAGGTLAFGNVTASTGTVSIGSGGTVTGGAITAGDRIELSNTAGAALLGNLDAASDVLINAAGNLTVGNVSAARTTVELRANAGSLTTGAITAATDTALIASGDISTDVVSARDILLLAGGSVRTASLASRAGRILAASNTLGAAGGAIGEFNFDAVFAQPLVASGGALTVSGPVTGATFTAAVAGDADTQGITASRSIFVDAGGTARLGGVWRSPSIELRANDLVMPAGSGLNAGVAGTITLVSRNAAGLRIGDGLDGSVIPAAGFSLDNGEWSRINSGSLSVFGQDVAGAVDIVIGKLDVTGPDAGSTIDDPLGTVRFSTGTVLGGASSGTIRVVGALSAVGFRATNALVFNTGQFQIASDTGSLAVLGRGGAPTGTLRIDARDIHVAAAPLLASLAADPFFAGVEPALDRVSAGANGPVLQAGALDFTVGRSFYIQRSGGAGDPLGFEETFGGFNVRPAGAAPIAVIINGTFRTAAGLIGGSKAWLQFKQSGIPLSGFTPDSRLNGCLLTADLCGITLNKGEPDPGIRTVIDGVDKPVIGDAPSDPDERKLPSQNAIQPPPLLLPVQPDALPGQIDEPIAGSGNPALSGGAMTDGARP